MSDEYRFEDAEFGEPLDADFLRVTIFPKGDGLRVKFERKAMPVIVKRPGKTVDFSSEQEQTKGRPTT